MNKKILSLVLTGVLSASLLVGCKAKDNSAGSDKLIISTWGLNEDVLKKEISSAISKSSRLLSLAL